MHSSKCTCTDGRTEAEREQKVLSDIEQYGCHIIIVSADKEGPGFAYSIGLFKNYSHPEVIVFGLNGEAMHLIINNVRDLVRGGDAFLDGRETDELLEGYPCKFMSVGKRHYADYLGYARWYYRGDDFPVLQCLWPDRESRFPTDSLCAQVIRERQPVLS